MVAALQFYNNLWICQKTPTILNCIIKCIPIIKWKQRSACLWGTPCPWLLFFCQCKFHEGNPFQYIINFGKSSFSVQCLHTTYLVGFCVPSWFCHKNFNAFYVCRTLKHLLPIYYKLQSTDGFNVLSPDELCRDRRTASRFCPVVLFVFTEEIKVVPEGWAVIVL